eukprot:CAMPEP_0204460510 /NCGR_PEP_ID=MMETSP0471-20130131/4801_1 /ASSEMBLY_ACC=CAM_ASM_000602 /TAXON_ID=2969 /ORGANISM="Oxyrrhis marina" /LENGTH=439 /DNA_ID=CAMNT_0051461387 /DNA_START=297 /DNA_END=1617 /DNA_ORIENTATION=+
MANTIALRRSSGAATPGYCREGDHLQCLKGRSQLSGTRIPKKWPLEVAPRGQPGLQPPNSGISWPPRLAWAARRLGGSASWPQGRGPAAPPGRLRCRINGQAVTRTWHWSVLARYRHSKSLASPQQPPGSPAATQITWRAVTWASRWSAEIPRRKYGVFDPDRDGHGLRGDGVDESDRRPGVVTVAQTAHGRRGHCGGEPLDSKCRQLTSNTRASDVLGESAPGTSTEANLAPAPSTSVRNCAAQDFIPSEANCPWTTSTGGTPSLPTSRALQLCAATGKSVIAKVRPGEQYGAAHSRPCARRHRSSCGDMNTLSNADHHHLLRVAAVVSNLTEGVKRIQHITNHVINLGVIVYAPVRYHVNDVSIQKQSPQPPARPETVSRLLRGPEPTVAADQQRHRARCIEIRCTRRTRRIGLIKQTNNTSLPNILGHHSSKDPQL